MTHCTVKLHRCKDHLKSMHYGQWLWLSGRAVAANTRDPRFESSHRQTFIEHLFPVNCVEKTKIKKKEAENGPFFFKKYVLFCEECYH